MSQEMTGVNPLGTQRIGKLMLRFAVPSIVAMIVVSLYNMVDQIFIGQGVGYLGNAATNIILPLSFAIMAAALMVGDGIAAYMSLSLGRGDPKAAARGVGNAIVMLIGISAVMTVLCLVFLEPLCRAFGATDAVLPYALDFGFVIVLGFFFAAASLGLGGAIRADGRPNITMIGLLIGFVANIALNPLFIFQFGWGVTGSALATIIGQGLNAAFYVICMFRFKTVKIDRHCFVLHLRTCGRILALGLASFITQMVSVGVVFVMNNLIVNYGASTEYGADIALAAYGVVMKVSNLLLSIALGLAVGVQPILGYNYGSGRFARVKKTYKLALIGSVAVCTVGFAVFQIFPEQISYLYETDSEVYRDFSVICFRICMIACIAIGPGMVTGVFFQAIGKPIQATVLSVSRQAVFLIPSAIIFCSFFGLEGALWASPFSDLTSCIMALVMVRIYWKSLFRERTTAQ